MQVNMIEKVIMTANVAEFVNEVIEAAKQGFAVNDRLVPPGLYGFVYECHMEREETEEDSKLTRADILAKARSAKKLKALDADASAEALEGPTGA